MFCDHCLIGKLGVSEFDGDKRVCNTCFAIVPNDKKRAPEPPRLAVHTFEKLRSKTRIELKASNDGVLVNEPEVKKRDKYEGVSKIVSHVELRPDQYSELDAIMAAVEQPNAPPIPSGEKQYLKEYTVPTFESLLQKTYRNPFFFDQEFKLMRELYKRFAHGELVDGSRFTNKPMLWTLSDRDTVRYKELSRVYFEDQLEPREEEADPALLLIEPLLTAYFRVMDVMWPIFNTTFSGNETLTRCLRYPFVYVTLLYLVATHRFHPEFQSLLVVLIETPNDDKCVNNDTLKNARDALVRIDKVCWEEIPKIDDDLFVVLHNVFALSKKHQFEVVHEMVARLSHAWKHRQDEYAKYKTNGEPWEYMFKFRLNRIGFNFQLPPPRSCPPELHCDNRGVPREIRKEMDRIAKDDLRTALLWELHKEDWSIENRPERHYELERWLVETKQLDTLVYRSTPVVWKNHPLELHYRRLIGFEVETAVGLVSLDDLIHSSAINDPRLQTYAHWRHLVWPGQEQADWERFPILQSPEFETFPHIHALSKANVDEIKQMEHEIRGDPNSRFAILHRKWTVADPDASKSCTFLFGDDKHRPHRFVSDYTDYVKLVHWRGQKKELFQALLRRDHEAFVFDDLKNDPRVANINIDRMIEFYRIIHDKTQPESAWFKRLRGQPVTTRQIRRHKFTLHTDTDLQKNLLDQDLMLRALRIDHEQETTATYAKYTPEVLQKVIRDGVIPQDFPYADVWNTVLRPYAVKEEMDDPFAKRLIEHPPLEFKTTPGLPIVPKDKDHLDAVLLILQAMKQKGRYPPSDAEIPTRIDVQLKTITDFWVVQELPFGVDSMYEALLRRPNFVALALPFYLRQKNSEA